MRGRVLFISHCVVAACASGPTWQDNVSVSTEFFDFGARLVAKVLRAEERSEKRIAELFRWGRGGGGGVLARGVGIQID
jgi:hypothetical protein